MRLQFRPHCPGLQFIDSLRCLIIKSSGPWLRKYLETAVAERAAEDARREEQEGAKTRMATKLAVLGASAAAQSAQAKPKARGGPPRAPKRPAARLLPSAPAKAPRQADAPIPISSTMPIKEEPAGQALPQADATTDPQKEAGESRTSLQHNVHLVNSESTKVDPSSLKPTQPPAARTPKATGAAKPRVKASDVDLVSVKAKIEAARASGSAGGLTIPELKAWLKSCGLPVGGKKSDLEARLMTSLTGGSAIPVAPEE